MNTLFEYAILTVRDNFPTNQLPLSCHVYRSGQEKGSTVRVLPLIIICIPGKGSFLFESVLAQTAGGADPIRRNLLPGGSGSDAVLGIAYRGIIDVAAGSNILIHEQFLLPFN